MLRRIAVGGLAPQPFKGQGDFGAVAAFRREAPAEPLVVAAGGCAQPEIRRAGEPAAEDGKAVTRGRVEPSARGCAAGGPRAPAAVPAPRGG